MSCLWFGKPHCYRLAGAASTHCLDRCHRPGWRSCTGSTCSGAALAVGASATFRYTFLVNAAATGSLSNTATVTAAEDETPVNNTSTATSAVVADVPALSPLGLALLAIALAMVALYVRGS